MDRPWTTLNRRVVYDNAWIEVRHDEVIAPTGKPGIYGTVHYKNYAIGILPVDEAGNTWLVGQHRYPLRQYSWEIPEGGGPVGGDILEAARRELAEEAGLEAAHWREIQRLHLSNSVSDELGIIYLATGLSAVPVAPDDTEVLKIRKLPLTEAFGLVRDGTITDTMSVVALLHAELLMRDNLLYHGKED